MRITTVFASLFLSAAAIAAPTPPGVTNQLSWDGLDGYLSMETPRPGGSVLSADDFYVPASTRQWVVREIRALVIADSAAPASEFRLRIFADFGHAAGSGAPSSLRLLRTGAASVTDRGLAILGYHLYEVRFNLGPRDLALSPNTWNWVCVDHVNGPADPRTFFIATFGAGALNGSTGQLTSDLTRGPWHAPEIGSPTDFAYYVRAEPFGRVFPRP